LRPWLPANQAFFAAGIALSHAAFLLACVGVHRIGEEVLGTRAANRAVWLLCLFPFALFFSAAYTESLYLALAVWAFVFARQRRWVLACLLAGLCAATRVPGVLVGAALAIEYLNQKGFSRRALDRDALAFLLVPLFFLLFLAYLQVELGDPFVFAKAQAAWGRTGPEVLLQHVSNTLSGRGRIERVALNTWVLGAVLAALPLGVSAWRRLGASYGFWALASLAIGVSTGLKSTGRYIAVLFPLFLMLGIATGRRAIFLTVAAVFGLFQAVFAYYFTNWYLVN
jgi:Gpi18-like mannosyltransferase